MAAAQGTNNDSHNRGEGGDVPDVRSDLITHRLPPLLLSILSLVTRRPPLVFRSSSHHVRPRCCCLRCQCSGDRGGADQAIRRPEARHIRTQKDGQSEDKRARDTWDHSTSTRARPRARRSATGWLTHCHCRCVFDVQVKEVKQPHYLENFVQCIFDSLPPAELTGSVLVLSGDGTMHTQWGRANLSESRRISSSADHCRL